MNTVLKLSFENNCGNLIWMPPYLYPVDDLENGIEYLRNKGYWVSLFPEKDGLSFKMEDATKKEEFIDFELAFPWMKIKKYEQNEEFDFERDILNSQIIILPLTRLKIDKAIYSKEICVFPAGEFQIHKINFKIPEKFEADKIEDKEGSNDLRDLITSITQIDKEVYLDNPLVVFRDSITIDKYKNLSHQEDVELIKKYSEKAEDVLDLIRFFECNYITPEILPARAGLWDDRYSTSLIYFPVFKTGFVQSREVEIKTLIKGIGGEFTNVELINSLPIFIYSNKELGEVGRICKYALKLNTLITESDNHSNKFIQIMTLFEYLGNPYDFVNFKKIKGVLISYIAKNKKEYHELSEKFRFYSENIRTEIIHNGKRIEDLLTNEEINDLFVFFHQTNYIILYDFMMNYDLDWIDYETKRQNRQKQIIN